MSPCLTAITRFTTIAKYGSRLEGKVAVVTGGAGGIGEAITKLFRSEGAQVVIADTDERNGKRICQEIDNRNVRFVKCDVTNDKDMEAAVGDAVEHYGALDIMVNNAGIMERTINKSSLLVTELNPKLFKNVMEVNVLGCALGIKHAARAMLKGKVEGGSIVCTASVSSVMGGMATHSYTASKHAMIGLMKNAASELGHHGIRVNAVSPFGVPTRMSMRFFMDSQGDDSSVPDVLSQSDVDAVVAVNESMANLKGVSHHVSDVAHATLFLASNESRYVSGHNLVVDGGLSVCR